jgi:hypothetical protein
MGVGGGELFKNTDFRGFCQASKDQKPLCEPVIPLGGLKYVLVYG